MKRVTVAQAKNHLPALLHEATESGPIEILRRDKPVAVIVAHDEFQRLRSARGERTTFDAIMRWREKYADQLEDLDLAGAFHGTRDQRPPRAVKW